MPIKALKAEGLITMPVMEIVVAPASCTVELSHSFFTPDGETAVRESWRWTASLVGATFGSRTWYTRLERVPVDWAMFGGEKAALNALLSSKEEHSERIHLPACWIMFEVESASYRRLDRPFLNLLDVGDLSAGLPVFDGVGGS